MRCSFSFFRSSPSWSFFSNRCIPVGIIGCLTALRHRVYRHRNLPLGISLHNSRAANIIIAAKAEKRQNFNEIRVTWTRHACWLRLGFVHEPLRDHDRRLFTFFPPFSLFPPPFFFLFPALHVFPVRNGNNIQPHSLNSRLQLSR